MNSNKHFFGFKSELDDIDHSFNIKKTLETQDKEKNNFNEAFQNNYEWFKNWYDKRRQLSNFKDVANFRYNIDERDFHPNLSDRVNMGLRDWELNSHNKDLPFPSTHWIPRNYNAMYDMRGQTWYDVNAIPRRNFIDKDGKLQNGLITHEESHLRDHLYPQQNTKFDFEDMDKEWRKPGGGWDPIELIISKEDIKNAKDNKLFNPYYHYQPTEVRARLNVWRQRNNIDPLKNYSPDEIQKIMDENLKNKDLDHNIKELYQLLKNDPKNLKFINDMYVGKQNNVPINMAKYGGRIKYNNGGKVIVDGKEVNIDSNEYRDMYASGNLMNVDKDGIPIRWSGEEAVVTAQMTDEERQRRKNAEMWGSGGYSIPTSSIQNSESSSISRTIPSAYNVNNLKQDAVNRLLDIYSSPGYKRKLENEKLESKKLKSQGLYTSNFGEGLGKKLLYTDNDFNRSAEEIIDERVRRIKNTPIYNMDINDESYNDAAGVMSANVQSLYLPNTYYVNPKIKVRTNLYDNTPEGYKSTLIEELEHASHFPYGYFKNPDKYSVLNVTPYAKKIFDESTPANRNPYGDRKYLKMYSENMAKKRAAENYLIDKGLLEPGGNVDESHYKYLIDNFSNLPDNVQDIINMTSESKTLFNSNSNDMNDIMIKLYQNDNTKEGKLKLKEALKKKENYNKSIKNFINIINKIAYEDKELNNIETAKYGGTLKYQLGGEASSPQIDNESGGLSYGLARNSNTDKFNDIANDYFNKNKFEIVPINPMKKGAVENDAQEFLTKMINSPLFEKRYNTMRQKTATPEEVNAYKQSMLNNMDKVQYWPIGYESNKQPWMQNDTDNWEVLGYYVKDFYPTHDDYGIPNLSKDFRKRWDKYHTIFRKNNSPIVTLHELSHASTISDSIPSKVRIPYSIKPEKAEYVKKYTGPDYQRATEHKAYLDQLRKYLYDKKIYDATQKEFDETDYDNLIKEYEKFKKELEKDPNNLELQYLENPFEKNILPYDKENTIKLFNSYVNNKNNTPINIAKYGGRVKFDIGGETNNENWPKNKKRKLKKNQVQVDQQIYDVGSPSYAQMYEDKFEGGDVVWDNLLEEWVSIPRGMNDAWEESFKEQRIGKAQDKVRAGRAAVAMPILEMTGAPGAGRFARDPVKNLKGAYNVVSNFSTPGLAMNTYNYMQGKPFFNISNEDMEGFANTVDVAGLAAPLASPLIKQGLKIAPRALSSTSRMLGRIPDVNPNMGLRFADQSIDASKALNKNTYPSILENPKELNAAKSYMDFSDDDIIKLEKYLDDVYDYNNLTEYQKWQLLDRETYYLKKNNISINDRINNNNILQQYKNDYTNEIKEYFNSPKFRERVNKQYGLEMDDQSLELLKNQLLKNLEKKPFIRPDEIDDELFAAFYLRRNNRGSISTRPQGHTYFSDVSAKNKNTAYHEFRHQLTNAEDESFLFPSQQEIEDNLIHKDLLKYDSDLNRVFKDGDTGRDYYMSPQEFIVRLDELKRDLSKVGYDYKTQDLTPEILKKYRGLTPKEAIEQVTGKNNVRFSELSEKEINAVHEILEKNPERTKDTNKFLNWFKPEFLINQINNKWGFVPASIGTGAAGYGIMQQPKQQYKYGGKIPYTTLKYKYGKGGNIKSSDKKVNCDCGWSWNISDGGSDPYVCHKCGNDNSYKKAQLGFQLETTKEDTMNEIDRNIGYIMKGKEIPTGVSMTKLNPNEEYTYQQWVKGLTPNLRYSAGDKNYDMRGAWQVGEQPELFYYNNDKFMSAHPIDVTQERSIYEPHLFSRNPYTGKSLKGPNHPSFMHALKGDIKDGAKIKMDIKSGDMYTYKKGGNFGGLDRWFAEKWVDVKTGKPCGRQEGESRRSYPACRPSVRVNNKTPKTSSELSSFEKEKFKRSKTSSQRIKYQHKRNK